MNRTDTPDLASAFETAAYQVRLDREWYTVAIASPLPPMLHTWVTTHGRHGVVWIITAHNPGGRRATAADNQLHDRALRDAVMHRPWHWLMARNRDPTGQWPDEPAYWVAGPDADSIRQLAMRFGQAAIVRVDERGLSLDWMP
ncbi:DUF3293 domain-containing protein [Salinisphaera sp. Q1T1-3]|uniref:DUF3293 domain-containing protein n=1 Tax=Salinisphaera sp. Q1T1-3 TaxID=2321229 RepID=UPI000E728029|nr:DUF3293 domain-containing protein [Salinisphaera sp. Q1T1-3]RJS95308.1 DUF3293 domain-containing protein [Salinisphaera sp. Q1T1-3]